MTEIYRVQVLPSERFLKKKTICQTSQVVVICLTFEVLEKRNLDALKYFLSFQKRLTDVARVFRDIKLLHMF